MYGGLLVISGGGVVLGGIGGCFVFPLIDKLLPLRPLYLAIGVAGSAFTLSLILLPHTPLTFAIALIGENVFQALAITASIAIAFEAIGRSNPLAATTYAVINAAFNTPITYMLFVDGAGYERHGIAGSFAADAGLSLAASLLLGTFLIWRSRRSSVQALAAAELKA